YSKTVTYETWVLAGIEIVRYYQRINYLPTFLFGLSAGGMLAYQISNECSQIDGLIVTCLLDQRENMVVKNTAKNQILGVLATPFLSVAKIFAGNVKVPMKWVSNMKVIANHDE
ncbi:alpha/beta hydrolase, partial [Pseudomonas otitidis]